MLEKEIANTVYYCTGKHLRMDTSDSMDISPTLLMNLKHEARKAKGRKNDTER